MNDQGISSYFVIMNESLSLYRRLLREASKLLNYNFREYAIRRIRDGFIANRSVSDPQELARVVADGKQNLDMLCRQVVISRIYIAPRSVVENYKR